MKTRYFKSITLALTLALSGPAIADAFKPITIEAVFREQVMGKKLTIGENHLTIRKNGKLDGNFGGKKMKGARQWRGAFWCRTLTTHSKNTDCQAWEADGNVFRVTRDKGTGKGFEYTAK